MEIPSTYSSSLVPKSFKGHVAFLLFSIWLFSIQKSNLKDFRTSEGLYVKMVSSKYPHEGPSDQLRANSIFFILTSYETKFHNYLKADLICLESIYRRIFANTHKSTWDPKPQDRMTQNMYTESSNFLQPQGIIWQSPCQAVLGVKIFVYKHTNPNQHRGSQIKYKTT